MSVELMRSSDLYDRSKPKRLQKHQKPPAPVGHTSSSPGPWLTKTIVDSLIPDPDPTLHPQADEFAGADLSAWRKEQYTSARIILDSFRFKPRYKTARTPLQHDLDLPNKFVPSPTFYEDEPQLETRTFCHVTSHSDPEQLALEQAPYFKRIEQPNVLSGSALHAWRVARYTAKDMAILSAHEAKEEAEAEKSDEELETSQQIDSDSQEAKKFGLIAEESIELPERISVRLKTARPRVRGTSVELNEAYSEWFGSPSDDTRAKFTETLHYFLCRLTGLMPTDDGLRINGLSDDFQQDFLLKMLDILDKHLATGRHLHKPAAFIKTVWEKRRLKSFRALAARQRREQSVDLIGKLVDDSDEELTRLEVDQHANWSRGISTSPVTEQSDEEIRLERLAQIQDLPPDIRDLVGMHLLGGKQREIAEALGFSQQTISKRLSVARTLLQASPVSTT